MGMDIILIFVPFRVKSGVLDWSTFGANSNRKFASFLNLQKNRTKTVLNYYIKSLSALYAKQTETKMAAHSNAEMPEPTRQSTSILYITRRRSTSRSVNTTCNREDSNLNILKNRT